MHLPLFLSSMIALSSAAFHLVAQNAMSQDDPNVFVTNFFVIGSSDDTHDNKCSNLINGQFLAPVSPFFNFPDAQPNSNGGLGLIQNSVFSVNPFCGLADGTQFVKDDGDNFTLVSGKGQLLGGSCSPADQIPENCFRTVTTDDGTVNIEFGTVVDLLFCNLDLDPNFCDPAF